MISSVALRRKEKEVQSELKQKMYDLYIAMGYTNDQSVKMV